MSPNPQQSAQDKKNQADVEKSRQIAEQQRAQVAKDREAIASKAAADQQKAREKNQQNNNQSTQSTEQQQQTQQQQQTTTQEQKTTTQDQQQQQTTQEAQQAQPTEQPPAPPVEQAQDNGASIVDPGTDIFPEQTANPRAKEVADPPLASFLIDPSSTPAAIPTPEPTPTFDLGPSTDSVSSAVPSITGDPIANANSTIPTTSTKKECTKKHTDIPPGTTGAFNTSPNGALPSSSSNQGAMIAGAVVGSLVGLALICLLAFLWRKGKIRKPSFPALPSAFTGRGSGMSRLTSPFSRFQSPLSTFQVFLRRRASDSSSEKDPMAETYPNISSESPSRSPRHSFSQVLYDVDRDREIEEVQSMDGGFMRTLSTVIEESKGSTRRTSLRSDPPLTYPDSIHTRSSGLLPSEAGDESRSSSETRTILLPPPFPTASRRSSDPVSPVSPEVRTNSGYGPWRDSMWSFNPTPINGPSPRTSYFRTTSRDFLSPSDRISKSSVYSQDAPRFRTVDSWVGNQSSRTNPSQALTSNPPSSALRAMPGRSHQRHQAQPQIPSQFVGSGSLYSPRARRSTVGDSAWPAALQPPLSPGQHRRDDSSSTATIFRQHPGDLVQL